MKSKLFNKIFLTVSVIIVLSCIIVLTTVGFVTSNFILKDKHALLTDNCNSIAKIASTDINSTNFKRNLLNIIHVQKDVSDIDIFICDKNGKVILCGCDEFLAGDICQHTDKVLTEYYLEKAQKNDYFEIGKLNNIYNETSYIAGVSISNPDNTVNGYVFSSTSAQSLRELLKTVRRMSFIYSIIPIVIIFFVLYSLTIKFSKPLKSMSVAAKFMSQGDFSRRIPVTSDDEIGELAISFNNMTNSLAKLESMRRSFIGNVSHELRTPMTTISGFIDGIIDGTIEEEKREYYLKIVSAEIKRLSRVVESMLNLSELESGAKKLNPKNFNFSECIINVILSREAAISAKGIDVEGLEQFDTVNIRADYDLIYQVIYNLIDNAVKFTNEGGKISFKMLKTDSNVQLSISNTGTGISKDALEHVFERFYKGDKSRSANSDSVGIGLFIVKKIIDIHGGKILADSCENEYTVFKIMLPLNCSETEEATNGRKQNRTKRRS